MLSLLMWRAGVLFKVQENQRIDPPALRIFSGDTKSAKPASQNGEAWLGLIDSRSGLRQAQCKDGTLSFDTARRMVIAALLRRTKRLLSTGRSVALTMSLRVNENRVFLAEPSQRDEAR
jgi:hypothetical protein